MPFKPTYYVEKQLIIKILCPSIWLYL